MTARSLRCLLVPFLVAAACAGPEPVETPPAAPSPAAPPPAMPAMESTDVDALEGVVGEVLAAGHYTYVRVGDDWAVVMGELDAQPGQVISLRVQASQTDFHSRRLDRDFERLFFASVPKGA